MNILFLIPERTELWHPMVVHFPIVLTLLSTLAFPLVAFVPAFKKLMPAVLIALTLGTLGALVAINTGEAAEEVVEHRPNAIGQEVDHDLIHEHEEHAEAAYNLLGVALLVLVVVLVLERRMKPWLAVTGKAAVLAVLVVASLQVLLAADYGGKLVYEQGAGVVLSPDTENSNNASEHDD